MMPVSDRMTNLAAVLRFTGVGPAAYAAGAAARTPRTAHRTRTPPVLRAAIAVEGVMAPRVVLNIKISQCRAHIELRNCPCLDSKRCDTLNRWLIFWKLTKYSDATFCPTVRHYLEYSDSDSILYYSRAVIPAMICCCTWCSIRSLLVRPPTKSIARTQLAIARNRLQASSSQTGSVSKAYPAARTVRTTSNSSFPLIDLRRRRICTSTVRGST